MPRILLAALCVLIIGTAVDSQQLPKAPGILSPIPFNPNVKTGTLDNGMTYFIMKNAKPEKRMELRLAVNAGSVLERDDQQGLAHFCEHMAFNGTTHFKKDELVRYLESIGTRFGNDLNAYTGFDETVYMLSIPTDKTELLDQGFQVLEDWAHNVSFDDDEIDKERGVILEEQRQGKGAAQRIRDKQFPVMFAGSKYADRLPIGKENILKTFPHDTLRAFYREWYRPDLMAVVAVGDFDPADIEQRLKKHFAGIAKPATPTTRPAVPVPNHSSTLYSIATDPEATGTSIAIMYLHDPEKTQNVGDYRATLVRDLYESMLNARLRELLQKADPPFLAAYAGYGRLVREKDVYRIGCMVENNGVNRGLEAVLTEAARVRQHGFTESELERAKTDMLRRYEEQYNERDKTESAGFARECVSHFLNAEPMPGIDMEYAIAKKYVPSIALAEVNALSTTLISDKNIVITLSMPQKEGVTVPTEQDIAGVIARTKEAKVEPYVDAVSNTPLAATPLQHGRVEKETRIDTLGLTEWKLSNGVRVLLKPTAFKNDEIVFSAWSPGGASVEPASEYYTATLAGAIMDQGGLASFDAVQLRKRLSGKVVSITPYISDEFEGLSGSVAPKDLETLFQLTYLTFTAPRKDTAVFLSMKKRFKTMLENMAAMPEAAFRDTLSTVMANYHPLRKPFTATLLESIDLETADHVYRDRFGDASDFTFLFVGNIDLAKMKPLVETWLGALPALHRNEQWKDLGVTAPAGPVERVVHKGIAKKSMVVLAFNGTFDPTLQNRYDISSLEELMNIKLREAIREEKGGTYGVGVNVRAERIPKPEYRVSVMFGCDPARVDELVKTAVDVMHSIVENGASDEDLNKIKELQRREREKNLKENSFWLSRLGNLFMYGDDPSEVFTYDALVDGLTSASLKSAAAHYLTFDTMKKFVLLPASSD